MKTNIVRDGRGHIVGYIDELDTDKIARDKNGRPVGRYWRSSDLTTDLRTGGRASLGDHTMRLLGDS